MGLKKLNENTGLYPHRVAGGHCDYRHPGGGDFIHALSDKKYGL